MQVLPTTKYHLERILNLQEQELLITVHSIILKIKLGNDIERPAAQLSCPQPSMMSRTTAEYLAEALKELSAPQQHPERYRGIL